MIDLGWLRGEFPELTDVKPLGRGGQKEVFSAQHADHGPVVLKVFHVGADKERAAREVRASLALAGTKLPETYDLGTRISPVGEVLWVCEQWIGGENLRALLQVRVLTDDELLGLSRDMLEILCAAETAEIVHRDVKPDNIIQAPDGSFWLIDFGLARHLELSSLTATGLPFGVGTPGYASPEQFRNLKAEIDGRADLFGLGVTIFESAEGTNPLRAGARDMLEVLLRTETMPVPRIARVINGVDEFADLVFAMTRPRRMHRPESVAYARRWLEDMMA